MAGRRSVVWLGTELTLTIYLFACLAFGNHKTNTLNGAKHAARADFFEQTKIKSWRCHIKQREGMDRSTCNFNQHYQGSHITEVDIAREKGKMGKI